MSRLCQVFSKRVDGCLVIVNEVELGVDVYRLRPTLIKCPPGLFNRAKQHQRRAFDGRTPIAVGSTTAEPIDKRDPQHIHGGIDGDRFKVAFEIKIDEAQLR